MSINVCLEQKCISCRGCKKLYDAKVIARIHKVSACPAAAAGVVIARILSRVIEKVKSPFSEYLANVLNLNQKPQQNGKGCSYPDSSLRWIRYLFICGEKPAEIVFFSHSRTTNHPSFAITKVSATEAG